jgi:hypothetical protein
MTKKTVSSTLAAFVKSPAVVSFVKVFLGGFVTVVAGTIATNVSNGVVPPVTLADLATGLWAGVGAIAIVTYNYFSPNDTRYGVGSK